MAQRMIFWGSAVILLIFTMQTFAGQGLTCADFSKLKPAEQKRYLEGYVLGAAMELGYFKNNILTPNVGKALEASSNDLVQSVAEWGIGYIEQKYTLINIAGAYPVEFHQAVHQQCTTPGAAGAGMFDVLPVTLEKMKKTSKYPVSGM